MSVLQTRGDFQKDDFPILETAFVDDRYHRPEPFHIHISHTANETSRRTIAEASIDKGAVKSTRRLA